MKIERTYLTANEDSWIASLNLPYKLLRYASNNFETLFDLHPSEKGSVLVYDKDSGEHKLKQIFRYYESYLNTPKFDPHVPKSYMFSGDKSAEGKTLPLEFEMFYQFALENISKKFNQSVINWYEPKDYIEMHSDCTSKMILDPVVAIINLNESTSLTDCRTLLLESRSDNALFDRYEFKLTHGRCILMGGKMQENYRHGVNSGLSRRISITFREMKLE